MSRSWTLFLRDMLEAASKVVRYPATADRPSFFADEQRYDATVHNLYVLGEASKRIPETIRTAHPEVDWRRIAGLRDVLAHAYFAVNEATRWEIIHEKVPPLATQLEKLVAEYGAGDHGAG